MALKNTWTTNDTFTATDLNAIANQANTSVTATSLGIPTNGVTDAAPIINALPVETGVINFSGTILCKSPITLPHGTTLWGNGRSTEAANSSIIKFDPTASWGANPKLLTLGGSIAFATRVVDAVIDCQNIPQSTGVYSRYINEQSGLFNVLIRKAVSKGFFVDGSLTPDPAQNWGSRGLEITMSASATSGSIGIDVIGGSACIRDLSDITVTVEDQTFISGMTGIRLNGIYGGALRDIHLENLTKGISIGPTDSCSCLTVENIHGHTTMTDLVVIETATVSGNNHDIQIRGLASAGTTNLLRDVPRSRTYTRDSQSWSGGYYSIGHGADGWLPVQTDMTGYGDDLVNAQTGTSYTLAMSDMGHVVTLSNASAIALTVPTNAVVDFPIGAKVTLRQLGAGQVTIGGAGVTINGYPGLKIAGQYGQAILTKTAINTWFATGNLST